MRLFIATSFPDAVIRELNARVRAIRSRLPQASWIREESQHLTLAFLGEHPEALVKQLDAPLTGALASMQSFEARLCGAGVFPNARHARVGWAGLDPEARFVELARTIREVVSANGVQLDRADFKPHLTLMRMREGWPPSSIELFTRTLRDYASESFTVDSVTLYSSRLDPHGAVHTPQRTFALASRQR